MNDQTFPIQLYKTPDGAVQMDVRIHDDTLWLSDTQMSKLFGKAKTTINEHINNIYKEGELEKDDSIMKIRLSGNSGLFHFGTYH